VLAAGLVVALALAGCSLFGGDTKATSDQAGLSQLTWCDKPLVEFQDDGQTPQTTLTHWDDVQGQLGFTPYLPTTLPKGTCLVVAGGSIHDPIYGGHFSITYDLPGTGPLSFSEAPKRPNLDSSLQCTQAPGGTPSPQPTSSGQGTPGAQAGATTVCLGVISDTSISIASRQSQSELQSLFGSLKPNVSWVPTTSETVPPASPSSSASPASSPSPSPSPTGS
jgi:hypothetical protein